MVVRRSTQLVLAAAVFSAGVIACGGDASTRGGAGGDDLGAAGTSGEAVGTSTAATTTSTTTSTSNTSANGAEDGGSGATQTLTASNALFVQTDIGTLRGAQGNGVGAYLGVPFAAPPVGALRWAPPAPPVAWQGIRAATTFSSTCIQLATDGTLAPGGSEDCLTLNVWTPAKQAGGALPTNGKALPVMAFIHGGFFVKGGATATWHGEETYDGADLAARAGVVVVTLQYRLGAFGFLAHPSLATTDAPHGNYALLDQLAALKWVQRNIRSFGGDPSAVTIWGQSAGGTSVAALLATPLASGLFSRAVIESGGFSAYSVATANNDAAIVATALGCSSAPDVAQCLRGADANTVATSLPDSALGPQRWHFVADGVMLTDDPVTLFQEGTMNRVPVLLGNNRDELSSMINDYLAADGLPKPTDQASYESDVNAMYGKNGAAVLGLYPYVSFASAPLQGLARLVADDQYICPTRAAARALSALTLPDGSPLPVWRYDFEHTLDRADFAGGAGQSALGAYHFLEMPFLFHALAPADFTFDSDERSLSLSMIGLWSTFAKTGNPNADGATSTWPMYNASTDSFYAIDTTSSAQSGIRTQQCDFWDQH